MAVMQSRDTRSVVAGADLSAKQFTFVKLDTNAEVVPAGNGEQAFGICLVGALEDNVATVVVQGKTMVKCGGTVTAGGAVGIDAGSLAVNAASTDIIMGYATEAGVNGQIIAIELIQGGNAAA
tara:strand:- start:24 stop:392 length:369 start_codon:yes stop_codon:yes gene_type:complete